MVDGTFKKHGLSYQVAMEVGGWEVIKKYVELGLGISIIIRIGITREDRLEVIPAGQFFPGRTYGVVLRKGTILSPQARRFVNMLLSVREANVTPAAAGGPSKPVSAAPKHSR
jgi:LysR family transcriptional regulator, low CO2-responsive transcriptional regulator